MTPMISKRGATRKRRATVPVALALLTGLPLLLVGTTAVTASASPAPITIAYITDLTGEGGSENSTSPAGFEARLDLQNAQGGVNGHKLVPLVIDDQTNPSEIATAVQSAISKGAFGIVSQSPLMFLAAKYPQQAGMPVTGTYDDGPEWGQQPYTNMFAADNGSVDPKYPVNTQLGDLFKKLGGTDPRGVRLRHFAVVEPGGHRHRGLLQARGRQGRRARHHRPLRERELHQHGARRQAGSRERHCPRPWTPTPTTRWPRR